jgi:hypothetical protein
MFAVLTTAPTPVMTAQPNRALQRTAMCRPRTSDGATPLRIVQTRNAEMVVDVAPVAMEPALPRKQRTGAVRSRTRLAQRGAAFRAGQAMPATRHEGGHDMLTAAQVRHAGARFHDHACHLVPKHHRQRAWRHSMTDGRWLWRRGFAPALQQGPADRLINSTSSIAIARRRQAGLPEQAAWIFMVEESTERVLGAVMSRSRRCIERTADERYRSRTSRRGSSRCTITALDDNTTGHVAPTSSITHILTRR